MIRKSRKSKVSMENATAVAATGLPVDQTPVVGAEYVGDGSDNIDKGLQHGAQLGRDAKIVQIPFDRLYRHNNVRSAETEFVDDMVSSLKRRTFLAQHPIVISRKPAPVDKAGHDCLVLQGNRRVLGLEKIRETETPEEFARILPGGMIAAIVYDGLTDADEAILRIDHSKDEDRKGLDDWGWFLAVCQLVAAGLTQLQIGKFLGKNSLDKTTGEENLQSSRGWVQTRVNLARLPQYIQQAMKAYWTRKEGNLRASHIGKLFETFRAELASYPAGDGPQLKAAFQTIVDGVDDTPETKALTATAVAETPMSSKLGKELLTAATRTDKTLHRVDGPYTFADIDGAITKLEIAAQTLSNIRVYLGPDEFAKLETAANTAATPVAETPKPEAAPVVETPPKGKGKKRETVSA